MHWCQKAKIKRKENMELVQFDFDEYWVVRKIYGPGNGPRGKTWRLTD
jgi:hypothetical protein